MFRKILIGLLIVVLALVAVSYLLPREVQVARVIEIERPPADVFPHVNDLRAFQAWSPWAEIDPNTQMTYSGPEHGVGQTAAWSSENDQVGTGSQTITASEENRRVATSLDFGDMGTATAEFLLEPVGESGTRVEWAFETDTGMNPIARWMGLLMDGMVGGAYEKGLAKLKTVVEGG